MNQPESLGIDVHLQFKDFLRANYWFVFRSWTLRILMCFGALTLALVIFAAFNAPKSDLLSILVLAAIMLFLLINPYFAAKRHFASNRSVQEPIHYSFSAEGIALVAAHSSGRTAWANIRESAETKSNFLLFISNNQFYVIPKRCMTGIPQIEGFRALLRENVIPSPRKKDSMKLRSFV